jgi:membrane protease YdiL (CAAX protease family)
LALAVVGGATIIVALLFALWAHEGIRETDRWEGPLVRKAERAGDQAQVQSLELVFDAERAKLKSERRMWLWVAVGAAAGVVAGVPLTRLQSGARKVGPR